MRNLFIDGTGRNTHKNNVIGWGPYPFYMYFSNKSQTDLNTTDDFSMFRSKMHFVAFFPSGIYVFLFYLYDFLLHT